MFFDKFTVGFSPLNLLKEKEKGTIAHFNCNDDRVLDKLNSLGILPGLSITLERQLPDFVISVGDNLLKIDEDLAKAIRVKMIF